MLSFRVLSRQRHVWSALAIATAGLLSQPAGAQLLPLDIVYAQPLAFGSFVASSGGTITLSPSGGRTKSGGVVLAGPAGSYSAARFDISGPAGSSYSISLPADGTVQLSSGTQSMTLNAFTNDPGGTGTLPTSGKQALRVGARLDVGSNQSPGQYQGSFTVTVNYQ